jgi:hypothetical protein
MDTRPLNLPNLTRGSALFKFFTTDTGVLLLLALVKLVLHLATSGGFGYFRDEFYYMAAGRRLDFGYVDFPPLVALAAALVRESLGESLLALHFLPSLVGAVVVFLAGLMARALGGSRSAQVMAALSVLIAPQYLGMAAVFNMDSFDLLFWSACLYVLILIIRDDRPSLWLLFGLMAGLGLFNKITMAYFGFAVVIALLLTEQRKQFKNKELYLGGLIALACLAPYMAWNGAHGWPTLEFWRNYGDKLNPTNPLSYIFQQIMIMNPGLFPVWLGGLYFVFRPEGKKYRVIGIAYLVLLGIFMLQNAKNYFLAPFYPVLFALSAVMIDGITGPSRWNWFGPEYVRWTGVVSLLFLPLTVPVLPREVELRYLSVLGGMIPGTESHESGDLPQYFADRFGWEELTATVAGVYNRLPPEDQAVACIFADNYGEAGALAFFGPQYDLPQVISGHNNYYIWGPGECTGAVLIVVGVDDREELQPVFESVELAATTSCEYCMPYENTQPVFVCRGMRLPIEEAWPMVKTMQ